MQRNRSIYKPQVVWSELFFYQKADSLYAITYHFCHSFLSRGDRTVDQMIQAARSGKQNIVEGCAGGVTSSETEIKLLNVARASIQELREDYRDFLSVRGMPIWDASHARFNDMVAFCRCRNQPCDYTEVMTRLNAEELANMALTICHMVDKMITSYQKKLEMAFRENGGVRERMSEVRHQVQCSNSELIMQLQHRIQELENENRLLREGHGNSVPK